MLLTIIADNDLIDPDSDSDDNDILFSVRKYSKQSVIEDDDDNPKNYASKWIWRVENNKPLV